MTTTTQSQPQEARAIDRLLIAKEVAAMLRVNTRTVWRLRASGKLPAVQIAGTSATRFRQSDVATLISQRVADAGESR